MIIHLQTDRMLLREFVIDDADLLVELNSDPAVMRYINGGAATPRAEIVDDVLPNWIAYYERGPAFGFWAAVDRRDGTFLGWFHLRPGPQDPAGTAELGYRLRRACWGQGYATEGSRALISQGFDDFGLDRIRAETMTVNAGSRRVMEKSGLSFVRRFEADWPVRIPGDEHGEVEYAITRVDWLARPEP